MERTSHSFKSGGVPGGGRRTQKRACSAAAEGDPPLSRGGFSRSPVFERFRAQPRGRHLRLLQVSSSLLSNDIVAFC